MNTYPEGFYDLLTRALGSNDRVALQGFLDDTLAVKYNALQLDGFRFADQMQLSFEFTQLAKEVGMNVMANYYDLNSPAVPFGSEGFTEITGSIPRMKTVEYFDEDKFRKMAILEDRRSVSQDRVVNSAKKALFVTLDNLIGAHTNSLTYQRHQMISAGKLEFTADNNPYGIKGIKVSAKVPSANIKTLTSNARWWTSYDSSTGVYSSEGSSCNPIQDLKDMVKKARNKGIRGHFEVEKDYFEQVLNHSKVKEAIAVNLFPMASSSSVAVAAITNYSMERKIEVLGEILGAPVKVIDSIVTVEKYNKTTEKLQRTAMNAFEANVLVFVPDGSLGEVLTVEPLKLEGGLYGDFYGGRLLLTVGFDYAKKCQSYQTEMTSLVVPDKPNYMWYIHPYSA